MTRRAIKYTIILNLLLLILFSTFSFFILQDNICYAEDGQTVEPVNTTSKALRITIIVGIAIPSVIIAIVMFIPKKDDNENKCMKINNQNNIDYDESRSFDSPNEKGQSTQD